MKTEFNDPLSYYKHLTLFWTDLMYLMANKPASLLSAGPMRNFATNIKKISSEIIEANDDLVEFNIRFLDYYKQLADTWSEAQKKVNEKMPAIPNDTEQLEAYKRIWIDIFETDFTELFDSGKFGENYGKLVASELELTKHWNNIMSVLLQSANLPNRDEIDDVYKQLHDLRRKVAKLESDLQQKGEQDGK
ncbi:MAG: hypothetical protein FJ356_03005 [Thaumarchaeota archaeon]|nr:hypothetical protein [Nitrososphaerota archaeon]